MKAAYANVTEHLTTEAPSEDIVNCYYDEANNLYQELWYSPEIGMFHYEISSEEGIITQGYLGKALVPELTNKGWYYLGVL